jgi:hypothetical protein
VKFRRDKAMSALPYPERGGSLRELTPFLNINPKSEVLLLTWLTYCLRHNAGAYPIVALSGVQGAGKSTITRVLRSLVDPSVAALTSAPKSERDLKIAAGNSWLIALDNLSEITPAMSDCLCGIATGSARRERKLFTNSDEIISTFKRPQIINGIEELPIRGDLLSRSILVHLQPIGDGQRRDEQTFWREFESKRARLFGAMLEILIAGLNAVDSVVLESAPRMADFARWGVATEQAVGYLAGTFLQAYSDNRDDANAAALEASPIAQALHVMFKQTKKTESEFNGTALELLGSIRRLCENGFKSNVGTSSGIELRELLRHPKFPKTASALGSEVARIEPHLRALGIEVLRGRKSYKRSLRIRNIPAPTVIRDTPSEVAVTQETATVGAA